MQPHAQRPWRWLLELARACTAGVLSCAGAAALGAPGTILFQDAFTSNLSQWTINASGGDASISNQTASSGNSARLRWDTVTITSNTINANVPAARLEAWIRRGQDSFSEDPDADEDLVLEYLNASNAWVALETFTGAGTAGEIFQRSYDVPTDALHAGLRLRLTLLEGKGSDTTYWHVDDVVVTELVGPTDLGVGACETFESGLGNWTIASSGGTAGTSAATANSPTRSMYTRWGVVTVTSNPANLAGAVLVSLDVWVQRGDNAFSNRPENNENLTLEYLASGGTWTLLETFPGNGTAGEAFSRSYALPAAALHSGFRVRFGQTGGNGSNTDDAYWHVDDVCLSSGAAFYSFEETIWNGTGGQVLDGGSNGMNGTAVGGAVNAETAPALATNPGTCRYGVFDGNNDYVEVPDAATLDISAELTVAAWVYMRTTPSELHTIASKDTNYEFHLNASRQVYWWWNDSSGNVRSITTATAVPLNEWHHVAVTYQSGSQVVYIDGVSRGTATHTGTLAQNDVPFYVGTDWNFLSRAFDGYIDEVYVIPDALTQAEVQALRNRTHDCATAAVQFTINHDGFGINCVAETITVNMIDSNSGTPILNYNAQVQLEARTPGGALAGFGSWALVTGSGSFSDGTANDGIATYTWPLGQSQAVFTLSYTQGSSPLDIEVFQVSNSGIRDTDAEGNLAFSPNGFTVTAAALANPPVPPIVSFASTQTAGTTFPVHIAAYGQTQADPVCGVIEAYTGTKSLKFWSQYANPATGTLNVQINGVNAAVTEGAATAQNVTFTNGQASVTAKYKDVGQIRVSMKDDTTIDPTQLPTGIRGATANFVVRPYDFLLSNIRNAAGTVVNPQANDANGAVFVAAGAAFRVTVTVRDSEGSATPNYGRETIPETVRLTTQLHAPSGGSAPSIGSTLGFGSFASGVATGSDFTWQEVGIIRVLPGVGDSSYLGAGDVTGSLSERVGRFVPNHFTVALNTPVLTTGCAAGGFTYEGQAFGYSTAPVITATARSVSGAPTQNYTGTFFKLTNASLSNRTYASAGTLNTSGLPPTTTDPAIAAVAGGNATLTFSSGSGLAFSKAAAQPPYQAGVQLSILLRDADGVLANIGAPPGTVTFGSPGGIAFTTGAEIRHGRIRVATAIGSELIDLPVRMVAEYYASAGAGFVTNANDSCSNNVSLAFSGFTENLAAGETCVRDSGAPGASGVGCAAAAPLGLRFQEPPVGGDYNLRLAAPGAGNSGGVVIDATVPTWLRFDWNSATGGDENPTGQATFGIFSGESRQIYTREIY